MLRANRRTLSDGSSSPEPAGSGWHVVQKLMMQSTVLWEADIRQSRLLSASLAQNDY